jgi:hypothetical protein
MHACKLNLLDDPHYVTPLRPYLKCLSLRHADTTFLTFAPLPTLLSPFYYARPCCCYCYLLLTSSSIPIIFLTYSIRWPGFAFPLVCPIRLYLNLPPPPSFSPLLEKACTV